MHTGFERQHTKNHANEISHKTTQQKRSKPRRKTMPKFTSPTSRKNQRKSFKTPKDLIQETRIVFLGATINLVRKMSC